LEKKLEEERETRERLKTMQKEMEEIRAKMERYKKEVETCAFCVFLFQTHHAID
jgi:molecular chaperone GrpE (heat shock protein)